MSLLNRVKSVLGMNGSTRSHQNDPVSVTVEQEAHDSVEREADRTETTETTSETSPETDSNETESGSTDDPAPEPVTAISGIGPAYAEKLAAAGIESVDDLRDADPASAAEESGISEGRISGWIEAARER